MSECKPAAPIRSIESVKEYLEVLAGPEGYWESAPHYWLYRGQAKMRDEWQLKPKSGRDAYFGAALSGRQMWEHASQEEVVNGERKVVRVDEHALPPHDMWVFQEWCKRAVAYSGSFPRNKWERLALAQHYGLATRLLDWTTNPLVGLYFAVAEENADGSHGAVYAYLSKYDEIDPEVTEFWNFDSNKFAWDPPVYRPRSIDPRIIRQSAVFTFHSKPLDALVPVQEREGTTFSSGSMARFGTDLMTIVVQNSLKNEILRELRVLGFTRESLFPDMEGLSADLNREYFSGGTKTMRTKSVPLEWLSPARQREICSDRICS